MMRFRLFQILVTFCFLVTVCEAKDHVKSCISSSSSKKISKALKKLSAAIKMSPPRSRESLDARSLRALIYLQMSNLEKCKYEHLKGLFGKMSRLDPDQILNPIARNV
jgi:hypothetical protein